MKQRLEIRDDEPAYTMGVRASSVIQGALDRLGVGSAWVRRLLCFYNGLVDGVLEVRRCRSVLQPDGSRPPPSRRRPPRRANSSAGALLLLDVTTGHQRPAPRAAPSAVWRGRFRAAAADGAFLRRLARISVHEVEPAQGKDRDDEAHHDAEEHQLHLRAALSLVYGGRPRFALMRPSRTGARPWRQRSSSLTYGSQP